MKKNLLFYCEVAIFSALGLIFDYLCGSILKINVMGGSINIAMLPILLVAYRWGFKGGALCGLLVGTIQILWAGSNIIHPIQALLDYTLAYGIVGCAGIFFKNIQEKSIIQRNLLVALAVIVGVILRLLIATISGVYYWGSESFVASFVYNLTYLLPSGVICLILMFILINTLNKILIKK